MPSRLVAAASVVPSLACWSALGWGLRKPGKRRVIRAGRASQRAGLVAEMRV